MKKILLYSVAFSAAMLLSACQGGHGHDHEGHNHAEEAEGHEGHDHEGHEGHDHEGESAEKEAHGEGHTGEIHFSDAQAKAARLQLYEVQPSAFSEIIEVSGRLLPAQGSEATVTATMSGIVSQNRQSLTEGMAVGAGQTLFTINAKPMADGNPAAAAQTELKLATQALHRAEALAKERLLTQRELDEARARYETAKSTAQSLGNAAQSRSVGAPMGGFVKSVLVRPGDFVEAGAPLAVITQSQRLQLRADLPERHYSALAQISDANFRMAYEPQSAIHSVSALGGRLVSKGRASEGEGFFVPIIFELNNQGNLVAGSFAEIFLKGTPRQAVITVPNEAITEAQGLYFVYLKIHPETYLRQEVKLGSTDGSRTEILEGLKKGDQVVTQGAVQVRLAANATVIPEGHSH